MKSKKRYESKIQIVDTRHHQLLLLHPRVGLDLLENLCLPFQCLEHRRFGFQSLDGCWRPWTNRTGDCSEWLFGGLCVWRGGEMSTKWGVSQELLGSSGDAIFGTTWAPKSAPEAPNTPDSDLGGPCFFSFGELNFR